jgi:hypothetical protein
VDSVDRCRLNGVRRVLGHGRAFGHESGAPVGSERLVASPDVDAGACRATLGAHRSIRTATAASRWASCARQRSWSRSSGPWASRRRSQNRHGRSLGQPATRRAGSGGMGLSRGTYSSSWWPHRPQRGDGSRVRTAVRQRGHSQRRGGSQDQGVGALTMTPAPALGARRPPGGRAATPAARTSRVRRA